MTEHTPNLSGPVVEQQIIRETFASLRKLPNSLLRGEAVLSVPAVSHTFPEHVGDDHVVFEANISYVNDYLELRGKPMVRGVVGKFRGSETLVLGKRM